MRWEQPHTNGVRLSKRFTRPRPHLDGRPRPRLGLQPGAAPPPGGACQTGERVKRRSRSKGLRSQCPGGSRSRLPRLSGTGRCRHRAQVRRPRSGPSCSPAQPRLPPPAALSRPHRALLFCFVLFFSIAFISFYESIF